MKYQILKKYYILLIVILAVEIQLNAQVTTHNKNVNLLAIGNSFTDNPFSQLPQILKQSKTKGVIASITYPGCSLSKHLELATTNEKAYTYFEIVDGTPQPKRKISFKDALTMYNWDIVVTQQVSGNSGQYESFQPHLLQLFELIKSELNSNNFMFGLQMTWAYATTSNHKDFKNYNSSQVEMYKTIVKTYSKIAQEPYVDFIIPTGVSIQKARETELNQIDNQLTIDGYHLGDIGCFIAALTWAKTIFGNNIIIPTKNNISKKNMRLIENSIKGKRVYKLKKEYIRFKKKIAKLYTLQPIKAE